MALSLSPKKIDVSFSLASGTFGDSGSNTANVTGLRVTCHVLNRGGAGQSNMELAIYGLPLSIMNQLTTFGTNYQLQQKNGVTVSAGDADSGMSVVFQGNIFQAWVDGQSQPNVCLRVVATPGTFYNAKPQTPLSYPGAVSAATIANTIAGYLGLTLENNGVNTVVSNPYYASDAISMITELAEHAGFDWTIDKSVLAITPKGKGRAGDPPLISAQTGMVGYPIFVSNNLVVRSVFNPNIKYQGFIKIQSDLTPANGTWKVGKIEYELESKVPHGKWFNVMTCQSQNSQAAA